MNISKIYDWISSEGNYKKGVTGKEVLEHFGKDFRKDWNRLKRMKTHIFYEKGKWFSWNSNKI